MSKSHELSNFIWSIADLLRGPYRPPQYERVMLPLVVLRRFDCVLEKTKADVLKKYEQYRDKYQGDALDSILNKASEQRFHNHSPLNFQKLKGDADHIDQHLVSYIQGFSENVRKIFEQFEFTAEIERMREHDILFLVIRRFCEVDLHPDVVDNIQMGLLFEDLIRRFNEQANETAGNHFTPREVIRLMVHLLFINDDDLLSKPNTIRKMLDPTCGTNFTDADQLFFDKFIEAAVGEESLVEAAIVNPQEKFSLLFSSLLQNLFMERMEQNEDIFARFMNEKEFQNMVSEWISEKVYTRLRAEHAAEEL